MASPLPDPLDQSPYTLRLFSGNRFVGDTTAPTTASLGGHIAHAIGDYDRFLVIDRADRIVMKYNARGTVR